MKQHGKKVYGYARVSTKTQSIERQVENIQNYNDNAIIYQEKFTGTKLQGRTEFQKLLKVVKCGDTIVFDSVSRMSRNAEEGIQLYEELMEKGIELVFLKSIIRNTERESDVVPNLMIGFGIVRESVRRLRIEISEEPRSAFSASGMGFGSASAHRPARVG